MEFLKEYGFSEEELKILEEKTKPFILETATENKKLVESNLGFLIEYGIINYKEITINFLDILLLDPSDFRGIFLKYDKEDLINKILKNVKIVELL